MTKLSVWAPGRERVEAVLGDRRLPMVRGSRGWWETAAGAVTAGERYRFSLDGGEGLPDPRSAWQPDGVDGPSAVVDHSAYEWHDQHWRGGRLASSVLYELHVGTFTPEGSFDAAAGRLDHLARTGVDAVELLPVAEFPGTRGWGYDGVLLYAPHHSYGGPDGLKRLVDAAHDRGIAVVLDVVYNHLGPSGNHLGQYGPYFTDRYRTPWGDAVNVDGPGSDEVRRFVVDNALMWLRDYHIDGLRLDAVHAVMDNSAVHWLEELAGAVDALADSTGRAAWLIAESDRNDPRLVWPRPAGGYGLTATWSDDFHHAVWVNLAGESDGYYADYGGVAQLARTYEEVYAFGRDYSPFRDRHQGRPAGSAAATAFLGYAQNHDQIGNRAVGERSVAVMGERRARVAAGLVLTAPFVPMLFMGEEWGASTPWQYFTDHTDPELGRAVSDGRTHEFEAFGWDPAAVPDPQDPETFRRSTLDWSEPEREPHAALLRWHRELIALRRRRPELRDGRRDRVTTRWADGPDGRWLVVYRCGPEGPGPGAPALAIVANLGDEPAAVPVHEAGALLAASEELAGTAVADAVPGAGSAAGSATVAMPGATFAVVEATWPGSPSGAC